METRLEYEALRSIAFGSIGASYVAIGTAFNHPLQIIKIYNGTNEDVFISKDGVTDHDIIPTTASFVIDITTNHTRVKELFLRKGALLYAKQGPGGAPTSGTLYVTTLYGA